VVGYNPGRSTSISSISAVAPIVFLAAASLGGCRGSSDAETTRTSRQPTFTKDVAPIVFENCVSCHRPGEAAPFSLLTYRDARQHARTIVAATERRFMPPWLPEPGDFAFAGERRLTAAQIETLRRWEDQGAPEGDPDDLPPLPHFADGWRLGQPDLVITLPHPYTLPDSAERWRNFVVPIPVSATRFVKTVVLRPGSARFVHHALMGVDATRSSRRRDEKDADPGFDGMDMGDAQAPDGHLLGWTPGMAPFPGIEGKAWRLEPGTDLVLQLHLTPSGKPEPVNPMVGLYFAPSAPVGPSMYLLRLDADHAIDIPPGEKDFVVTDSFELPVDLDVFAVYPHAHFLARTMDASARLPNGSEQSLLRISNWDFKWQDVYRYTKPISLPRGATITMRYSYDNSADNVRNPSRPPKRVIAGLRSSDEMAHLQLQVMPRSERDLAVLKEAFYRHMLASNPSNGWIYYELANLLRDRGETAEAIRHYRAALQLEPRHSAARNNLGVVLADQGEVAGAIGQYREAIRLEPDFADAHFNLANGLRALRRLNEAVVEYREALRLEPHLAEAHTNLGEILASEGHMDEAIAQFRAALQIRPDSAEAHNNLGAALGLQGKMDEAIDQFRQALEIDPSHERARENLRLALEKANR
jgi:Tfp pilus assembly protein PilF